MSSYDDKDQGCKDEDCASDVWKDGCLACMCFNQGNASWCDGTKSAYYDNYYKKNGKNPFGDSNRDNRKCKKKVSPKGGSCKWNLQCVGGLECGATTRYLTPVCITRGNGGGPSLNCDPMSPYDNTDHGCHDDDCASDRWKDGCLACMWYNNGNTSWCDGTKSAYYDNNFEEHGENPFGDSNQDNRKCNTIFFSTSRFLSMWLAVWLWNKLSYGKHLPKGTFESTYWAQDRRLQLNTQYLPMCMILQ